MCVSKALEIYFDDCLARVYYSSFKSCFSKTIAFSKGVLKFKKEIEKQASTRVILQSGFHFARSRFRPLKPFLKSNHFSEKTANFTKLFTFLVLRVFFWLSSTNFWFKLTNVFNIQPILKYLEIMLPSVFWLHKWFQKNCHFPKIPC